MGAKPVAPSEEPRFLEEREERVKEIDSRIAELDAEFTGTMMTPEAREEWNALNAERDEQAATVKEMRARRDRLRQISANPGGGEPGAPTPSAAPAFHKQRGVEIYEISRIRADAHSEDEYREKLFDNARRAVERAKFAPMAGQDKERTAEHVEELLTRADDRDKWLAKRILITGNPVYERAFGKAIVAGGPQTWTAEEQRQMALSPDTTGGLAVPFALDPTVILTSDGSTSPLRQIARVEQIVTDTWRGITSSGVTVSRSGEGDEAGDNSFTVARPTVTPTRVIANIDYSVEIGQDWPQLRSEISRLLMDAKEREEDSSFVIGDGTGDNPFGVAKTLEAGSEVSMGAAGTLDVDDLYDLESELPVRFRRNAQFLGNKSTYNHTRGLSTGSDGGDLWVRLASGQPSELLGYSAHEASAMDSVGDADGRVLLFGDFSEFIIVDRLGMTVELQQHVLGANRRWTGQRAVVAIWRNSSKILVHNAFRVLTDPTAS